MPMPRFTTSRRLALVLACVVWSSGLGAQTAPVWLEAYRGPATRLMGEAMSD